MFVKWTEASSPSLMLESVSRGERPINQTEMGFKQRCNITDFVKKSYLAYFGIKLVDPSKTWAPHKVCKVCIEEFRNLINWRRPLLSSGVPMVWREQSNHSNDCYISSCDVKGKLLKDLPPEPRRLAVASFRLNTEHDILGKHLNRLGILPSASCILCHQQEYMDRQHLAKCPALKSSKEVDRYWGARTEYVKLINHPTYSPDLESCDCFLFPTIMKKMRRLSFNTAVAAIEIMSRSKSGVKRTPIDPDALKKAVEAVMAPPGIKISNR
ncbi:hypothetical protein ANN_13495 [Periplaneta americana]|uniref:Uncharacterized protein n=1 Tax=Periplaneta americana TaxID=6978 RepID=A0ABQ8TLB9_PERAM|nr:hypothetical protein ANN_13495 [Periplaneta americana]